MKTKKYCRLPAILLAFSLLTGMLSACAGDKTNKDKLPATDPGGVSGPARGRYVEQTVTLPPELADCSVQHMYAVENTLHLLVAKEQEDKTCLQEWTCQDGVFTEATRDWLAGMTLPGADWLDARLVQSADGTQYLYARYAQADNSGFSLTNHQIGRAHV